jgi:hypothetical protein
MSDARIEALEREIEKLKASTKPPPTRSRVFEWGIIALLLGLNVYQFLGALRNELQQTFSDVSKELDPTATQDKPKQ